VPAAVVKTTTTTTPMWWNQHARRMNVVKIVVVDVKATTSRQFYQGILGVPGIAGYEWVPATIGRFYQHKI
jgi:hypothetical protein